MDDELNVLAKDMYRAYGEVTEFKNYQGLPMPEWAELTPKIQEAWRAAAFTAGQSVRTKLDSREYAQIRHALNYSADHQSAGAPGHGQFILIAKLAKALGF